MGWITVTRSMILLQIIHVAVGGSIFGKLLENEVIMLSILGIFKIQVVSAFCGP